MRRQPKNRGLTVCAHVIVASMRAPNCALAGVARKLPAQNESRLLEPPDMTARGVLPRPLLDQHGTKSYNSSMSDEQSGNTGGVVALLMTVVYIGLTLYWSLSYSGLYKWVAEMQIDMFGGYEETITFVIVLLPGCTLAAVVRALSGAVPDDG